MLELPNGSQRSSADLVSALHTVGGCHQFQVVVRARDSVLIRIVPNRSWTRDSVEQVRQAVREHLDPALEIDVVELARLPLPASGKLMDVIRDGQ